MATLEWFDEDRAEGLIHEEDEKEELYCPYTNGPKCAVMAKGWQVQELCKALDCEQLRYLHHAKRRRKAA